MADKFRNTKHEFYFSFGVLHFIFGLHQLIDFNI